MHNYRIYSCEKMNKCYYKFFCIFLLRIISIILGIIIFFNIFTLGFKEFFTDFFLLLILFTVVIFWFTLLVKVPFSIEFVDSGVIFTQWPFTKNKRKISFSDIKEIKEERHFISFFPFHRHLKIYLSKDEFFLLPRFSGVRYREILRKFYKIKEGNISIKYTKGNKK